DAVVLREVDKGDGHIVAVFIVDPRHVAVLAQGDGGDDRVCVGPCVSRNWRHWQLDNPWRRGPGLHLRHRPRRLRLLRSLIIVHLRPPCGTTRTSADQKSTSTRAATSRRLAIVGFRKSISWNLNCRSVKFRTPTSAIPWRPGRRYPTLMSKTA